MLQATGSHRDAGGNINDTGSINNSIKKMDKHLKIGQALFALIGIIITVMTMIVNQSNKIETQRLRIEFLETASRDQALQIKSLNQESNQQYKEINQKLTDILISLQNKENKK
jgi:predicted site-specific integrase-resolvase